MPFFGLTARRWKSQANRAIAPALVASERRPLARRLALRLGRRDHLPLPVMIDAICSRLDDFAVRSMLAARYLDALQGRATLADYEEAKALERELRWAEHHLETSLKCPFLAITHVLGTAAEPDVRQAQVRAALADLVALHLPLDASTAASTAA